MMGERRMMTPEAAAMRKAAQETGVKGGTTKETRAASVVARDTVRREARKDLPKFDRTAKSEKSVGLQTIYPEYDEPVVEASPRTRTAIEDVPAVSQAEFNANNESLKAAAEARDVGTKTLFESGEEESIDEAEEAEVNKAEEEAAEWNTWREYLLAEGKINADGTGAKSVEGLSSEQLSYVKRMQADLHYAEEDTEKGPKYAEGQDVLVRLPGAGAGETVRVAAIDGDRATIVTREGIAQSRSKDLSTLVEEGLAYRIPMSKLEEYQKRSEEQTAKEKPAKDALKSAYGESAA